MNSKRLIACSLVALVAVAIFINFAMPGVRRVLASTPAAQTNLRKVKIVPGRTSPVEVTEVIWNGSPLSPDGGIPSGSDWIGNLQVRFKNKSDKPISFARFMLFDTSRPNTSSLMLLYGKEYSTDTSEPSVAPGEYGVAKPDIAMYGSTTGTTNLNLTTNKVVWNFNYDVFWAVGDLWEVDTSPNAPTKHKRIAPAPTPTPQAKATQPLRSPFVKARFNHAPAPAVAFEDPCESNPFIPECEELGPFCDTKLADSDATDTCSSGSGCGGAGEPHCFNSGCHPTGPATCAYSSPNYFGILTTVVKVNTVVFCYDISCPTNICGDNVNHSGYVAKGTTFPDDNCRRPASPIIVDMKGDGIKLTSAEEGVRFDLNVNGKLEQLAWTQADSDDAFLVLDRNGDGKIKTGLELFGDVTEQPDAPNKNGFLALKVFDANGDGVINANDPVYSQLRLWTDTDHDGRSDQGELTTLSARGVNNISTNFKTSRKTDQHGNDFQYRAKVADVKNANIGRWAWDVFLMSIAPPGR